MVKQIIRLILIKLRNLGIQGGIKFSLSSVINIKSTFEGYNKIGKKSIFCGEMGRFSYIGHESQIIGKVGRFCSIGNQVHTVTGTHPINYLSTHPSFFSLKKQSGYTFVEEQRFEENRYADKSSRFSIVIGNDVWIGSRALLIAGIKIGNGAIILANAVVTKDVPAYSIVGGVPAKVVKYRFNEDVIDALLTSNWWDKDLNWLKKHNTLFGEIKDLNDCKFLEES